MKKLVDLLFIGIFSICFSQEQKLTNPKLISYFEQISRAEIAIVDNDLMTARDSYKKAFEMWDRPQPKDIYNRMLLSLKLSDRKIALEDFQTLKCLEYKFDDDFVKNNFPDQLNMSSPHCLVKLDVPLKKELDSLFYIDQYYRKLSGGDYKKYQKEITRNDSIASTKLAKIIKEKGFPDAYMVGLGNKADFFPDFYYIIWHQLSGNLFSPQRVNFSNDLYSALNAGKIAPNDAAFLIELLNGTNRLFNAKHFDINQFLPSESDISKSFSNTKEKLENADCCYVHEWFFPEKRSEDGKKLVKGIDESRARIGLCRLDDDIKKRVFSIKNKEYQFVHTSIVGSSFIDDKYVEFLKKHLIKLDLKKK